MPRNNCLITSYCDSGVGIPVQHEHFSKITFGTELRPPWGGGPFIFNAEYFRASLSSSNIYNNTLKTHHSYGFNTILMILIHIFIFWDFFLITPNYLKYASSLVVIFVYLLQIWERNESGNLQHDKDILIRLFFSMSDQRYLHTCLISVLRAPCQG